MEAVTEHKSQFPNDIKSPAGKIIKSGKTQVLWNRSYYPLLFEMKHRDYTLD